MTSRAKQSTVEAERHAAQFRFVTALASDLSVGKLELPPFPAVATRVREALADETVDVDRVVGIVGAEPMLAAGVKMANSAALNRTGRQITELRTAIARMGHDSVRSAQCGIGVCFITAACK